MLNDIDKDKSIIYSTCDNCNKDIATSYDGKTDIAYLEEFSEYENFSLNHCDCGSMEVINLNLYYEEVDELFLSVNNLSEDEKSQRRVIKRLFEDLNFEKIG